MNHAATTTYTNRHTRRAALGGACLLALLGATAPGAPGPAPTPSTVIAPSAMMPAGVPVALNAAQRRSLRRAFAWSGRDLAIVGSVVTPRVQFDEIPGLKERSGYLNVKVKDRAGMLGQLAIEAAHTPTSQTRPADSPSAQARFATLMADADARIVAARARLTPSLREGYYDIDMHSVRVPQGVSAEVAAEALMLTGDYEYVSMDWLCHPTDTIPNDPQFNQQWYHASNRIDTVSAWDFTQGDPGTVIAVCDSGVDLDHPDLASALVPGYNAVDNLAQIDGGNVNDDFVGHGSLVAGSAAAIGNNGTGVSGIGWNFSIMPVRVSNNSGGTALLSEILEGARWASDNGAYAINCSFGGAEDSATRTTGGHIRLEGHLLVFAAGNDGLANQVNDWEQVTIVGASTQSDNWATWSHTGIGIDCIAPGTNIRSTNRTGGYSYATGTSFSAPITAGALALVHDANPALSADEVEYILLNACDDKQAPGQDDQTGWGRINVGRAVDDAIHGPSVTDLPFSDTFPDPALSNKWRNATGPVGVSGDAIDEPSAPYSMTLGPDASVASVAMRAGLLAGSPAEIRLWTQHRGVASGGTLTIRYLDLLDNWATLGTIVSDATNQTEFTLRRYLLPAFAMHDGLRLRLSTQGASGGDWFVDDIAVRAFVTNTLPWEDGFEDGITLTLDWADSQATATDEAFNEPEGTMSARLSNQQRMTSATTDVSSPPGAVYMRFYTQHRGVEAGKSLLVEYLQAGGAWGTLATIESDGTDQTSFDLHQPALPIQGYGANTAIRFTAQGDQSDDAWYIDAVAITTELIDEQPCNADLNGDGVLNFFDISAFLTAFGAQDPIADFTGDGVFNFFDVSGFLTAYSAGCP